MIYIKTFKLIFYEQTKTPPQLIFSKFESAVCDARGMWVYFDKVVPQDEEAEAADPKAKGKKAPAKGKPASATEETRPTYGRAWVNLTPLMHPGATKMTQRVFLNQI